MNWTLSCACSVLMAVASLSTASAANAECLAPSFDASQLLRDSALLFAGTLIEGDDYTLIFKPDRIWKGQPSRRATVYVAGLKSLDSIHFRPGERYLIAAHVLQKEERWSINIDDRAPTVFGIEGQCSPIPLSLAPALDKLARPRKPR